MAKTPDRMPGPLIEDEEIRLGTNAVGPTQDGAFNFNGSRFRLRDALGTFDPRTLDVKSGSVLAASFAGNPKKATVAFTTPFASASYAVAVTAVVTISGTTYSTAIESQTASSFVINMGANNIPSLVQVNWVAMLHGEST